MTSEAIVLQSKDLVAIAALSELALFERWRFVRTEVLEVTQRRLATEMGVDVRTVKGWEHPEQPRGVPTVANAERLAALAEEAGSWFPPDLFTAPVPQEQRVLQEVLRKLDLILAHLGIEDA